MRYRVWGRGSVACSVLVAVTAMSWLLVLDMSDQVAADLLGDLQKGLQTTGKLFGINTIADVADLVAKGFANRRGSQDPVRPAATGGAEGLFAHAPSMMTIMMKLLGLDGNQLGAMLVNGIVFLAHIIGTNLGAFRTTPLVASTGTRDSSTEEAPSGMSDISRPTGTPLDWLLRNPSRRFRVLLDQVENTDLTELLDREMDYLDRYPPEDTHCIRQLMCIIKPFIWKMQHVVREQILNRGETGGKQTESGKQTRSRMPGGKEILERLHANLPGRDEIQQQRKLCEKQYSHCTQNPS
ncbi:uncharacterized protein LOC128726581 [Anopheles nili]|uniref:uncharacterized protein LOC128726581 n=1 Tax=Anopheles nili TaxID=185578 RepID=UPI00237A399A|nr:uncharacterized protein LOC128726581 [Anopheles nili]